MGLTPPVFTITLDRKRQLVFDANAYDAFERETKKHFLEFYSMIGMAGRDALTKYPDVEDASEQAQAAREVLRQVEIAKSLSIADVSALVWCGLIEYSDDDIPHWPLTIQQVRRYIDLQWMRSNFVRLISALVTQTDPGADPDADPKVTAAAAKKQRPTKVPSEKLTASNGGTSFGPSPDSILGSLTEKSDA